MLVEGWSELPGMSCGAHEVMLWPDKQRVSVHGDMKASGIRQSGINQEITVIKTQRGSGSQAEIRT